MTDDTTRARYWAFRDDGCRYYLTSRNGERGDLFSAWQENWRSDTLRHAQDRDELRAMQKAGFPLVVQLEFVRAMGADDDE